MKRCKHFWSISTVMNLLSHSVADLWNRISSDGSQCCESGWRHLCWVGWGHWGNRRARIIWCFFSNHFSLQGALHLGLLRSTRVWGFHGLSGKMDVRHSHNEAIWKNSILWQGDSGRFLQERPQHWGAGCFPLHRLQLWPEVLNFLFVILPQEIWAGDVKYLLWR